MRRVVRHIGSLGDEPDNVATRQAVIEQVLGLVAELLSRQDILWNETAVPA
jgi:hypothetical protein